MFFYFISIRYTHYNLRISTDQLQVSNTYVSHHIFNLRFARLRDDFSEFSNKLAQCTMHVFSHSHGAIGSNTMSRVLGGKQKQRDNCVHTFNI